MVSSRNDVDSTDFGRGSTRARSLADLCSEAFLLTFHVRSGADPGHPDDVRNGFKRFVQDLESRAGRQGHSEEDIKAAVYGLCALVDETILNSRWSFKEDWAARTLQSQYFGDQLAGERFFDLLERIRQKGQRKAELLELFALILVLGFQGKYKLRGREEVVKLTQQVVEESNSYHERASGLSPHWKIPDEPAPPPARGVPMWVLATGIGAVVLVVVLFIVYRVILTNEAAVASRHML